jgi:hypothetical protein
MNSQQEISSMLHICVYSTKKIAEKKESTHRSRWLFFRRCSPSSIVAKRSAVQEAIDRRESP